MKTNTPIISTPVSTTPTQTTVVASPNSTTTTTVASVYGSGDVDGLDTLLNMGDDMNPVIINRYETAARQSTDESIDAILNNTYNVRSEKIESMLGEMLKIMRDRNKRRANRRAQQSTSQLPPDERFPSNDIPSQVERLSVG